MTLSKSRNLFLCIIFLSSFPGISQAVIVTPASVTGSNGIFNNSPNLIIDGFIPAENTPYFDAANVHWINMGPIFTIDLGATWTVLDLLLSVDNNDPYLIEHSLDATSWFPLFNILASDGEIPASGPGGGGMDTMSTDASNPEYVANLDFAAVSARYLRISGTGPDYIYAVGEIQISAIPIPAAVWLFGTAVAGLFGFSRRRVASAAAA